MATASEVKFVSIADYENAAKAKLPLMTWDYYSGGAQDEHTLRNNCEAYSAIALRYRVMHDVSKRDASVEVLQHRIPFPILIPPMAFQGLACPEGEIATARAAARAGTIMGLSMLSNSAVEDVTATGAHVWQQLYLQKDRGAVRTLVRRAEDAGCKALVMSVDSPIFGRQYRNLRNGFTLPRNLLVKNLLPRKLERLPHNWPGIDQWSFADKLDASLTWRDLEWLCSVTKLPVLVKGLVRGDDAALAVEHGARGVIVSNHGGRQLDTAPATIRVLEEVVTAVANRCEVFVDGGIRRGIDVMKALALGAKAVLMGRPILWGLAVNGEEGASAVLNLIRAEFEDAMALCGCALLADISRDLAITPPDWH